ncbi:MAG TPA: PqqD family peptide modification chaperone [Candidatus Acidoferrales bacterium]|nr:PqqD family peptide modification chaperone [Candidatus Acidoferrales bacterium]
MCDAETPEAEGKKSIFSAGSIIRVAKDQISCNLVGEAAILNIKSGVYYGLDSVGARVWELVQQPRSVNEVRETLLKEYDVEPQRCETDLLALLERLLAEGLIEVLDGPAA